MKVLILRGGDSSEREVSLRSGASVANALRSSGYEVLEYDPTEGLDGLSGFSGKVDCAFPILHGKGGEDGVIQKKLEELGIKYLGADSKVSALCFDKVRFKDVLKNLGFLTPTGETVDIESFKNSTLTSKPYVLKPIDGGSTIDTFIVRHGEAVDLSVFERHHRMLLEELIDGREITVPVLDQTALPVIEIIPPEGGEFDYENKYNGASQELCPPANINEEQQSEAKRIAAAIHAAVGVRHLSRTDIIIDKDNKQWVLELNTMPGMTDQSLFPKSAAVAGIPMEELVDRFVRMTTS